MYAKQYTGKIFLEEFVKRLIINSVQKEPKIEKTDFLLDKLEKTVAIPPAIKIEKKIEEKPLERIEVKALPQQVPVIMQTPIIIQKPEVIQKTPEKINLPIMDRISPILADPSVQSINCPGPDKNITIMRNGTIQTVAMSFTAEDITNFLKDVAEKTKIPLLPGLFKVVFQNLIITAVISEFVGTKFMIEKRMTPALPPLPIKAQFI